MNQKALIAFKFRCERFWVKSLSVKEENGRKKPTIDRIQELTEEIEKVSSLVEVMQKSAEKRKSEQFTQGETKWMLKERRLPVVSCVEWNLLGCFSCFTVAKMVTKQ